MGNWCGAGTFGRVYTASELMSASFFPDESQWRTGNGEMVDGLTMRQAFLSRQIGDKQSSLFFLVLIYFMLSCFIYLGVSVVPDYAPISQLMNAFSIPHSIWGIWPFLTVFVFQATFYFGAYFQVSRVIMAARAFYAILVIDILGHIGHLVVAAIELARCESDLCMCTNTTVGKGFLIALIAIQALFVIWMIIVYVVASSYVMLLREGTRAGWRPNAIQTRNGANVILAGVGPNAPAFDDPPNGEASDDTAVDVERRLIQPANSGKRSQMRVKFV